eukprot:7251447-Prorocentrum_lima.AAC.1
MRKLLAHQVDEWRVLDARGRIKTLLQEIVIFARREHCQPARKSPDAHGRYLYRWMEQRRRGFPWSGLPASVCLQLAALGEDIDQAATLRP